MDARLECESRVGVPEVVKPDAGESGLGAQTDEFARDCSGIEMSTIAIGEEPCIIGSIRRREVSVKDPHRYLVERHDAAPPFRLRLRCEALPADVDQRLTHDQPLAREIEIAPPQPKSFSSPKAGHRE